jgi:transposase-like protein
MSKRNLTKEQVEVLLGNDYVVRCSNKAITYNKEFKVLAIKQYNEEGLTSKEIFERAGFDLKVIGKDTPKGLLRDWNRKYRDKGMEGLLTETRGKGGGRPKSKGVTDKDKIEFLEAKVAYLKAENDFLARLRNRKK